MWKVIVPVVCVLLVPFASEARPRHHHHRHHYLNAMASIPGDARADTRIVGGRPAGCPHAFCGCEASLYKFGRIIPELNLAANWRRFPRTAAAPGMAAGPSVKRGFLSARIMVSCLPSQEIVGVP